MRFVWAAALFVLAGAGAASAQELALTWQAPEGCPAREAWLASLRARVDDAAWNEAAPKLRAAVRIEPTGAGYVLQLDTELDGVAGQRRLEAASCAELVEASALIVAFAIDPRAAERAVSAAPVVSSGGEVVAPAPVTAPPVETPAPAEPNAEPSEEPVPAPPRSEPRPPEPELEPPPPAPDRSERAPASTRFFVRPLALLDLGTLPDLAFGPAAQAGLRIHRVSIELGVSYLVPQSISEPDADRVVGELRWLAGSAGGCYALVQRAFELAPCLRMELGRIWGEGKNLEVDTFAGGATWLAFLGGVSLGYHVVDALALNAELSAGLPVTAAVFSVGGVGKVYESPAVVGRFSAGATVRF